MTVGLPASVLLILLGYISNVHNPRATLGGGSLEQIKIVGVCMWLPVASKELGGREGAVQKMQRASVRITWRISRRADSKQPDFKNIAQIATCATAGPSTVLNN
jgi:hypothetical protein